MEKDRLAAFSDGVIAVIITIMVLELHLPGGAGWGDLFTILPKFLIYALSFMYVAIYWNNHHHMVHTVKRVNGGILWANTYLLFWLSLVPFATAWMGEHESAKVPTAVYGVVLLMCAIAYTILQTVIIRFQGTGSTLARAVGQDWKGKSSAALYLAGIGFSFAQPWLAEAIYAFVAFLWLVPDQRIEKTLGV